MKRIIEKDLFDLLLTYANANDQNSDAERCKIIDIVTGEKEYQLTVCFNERKNQIVICEITDEFKNEIINDEIIKRYFDELVDIAINTIIDDKGLILHSFYREKIEPATECCELNQ